VELQQSGAYVEIHQQMDPVFVRNSQLDIKKVISLSPFYDICRFILYTLFFILSFEHFLGYFILGSHVSIVC